MSAQPQFGGPVEDVLNGRKLRDCEDGLVLVIVGSGPCEQDPRGGLYFQVTDEEGNDEGALPAWSCHQPGAPHLPPTECCGIICYEWLTS